MNTNSLEDVVYYHEVINRFYRYIVIDNIIRLKEPERDFDIFCEVVLHGNTLSYIASEYDISTTRVGQIVTKMKRLIKRFV